MVRRGPVRWLWLVGGVASVGLGSLGIIAPGLPTTVFFTVAAACFARSNPRLEQWVLDLPRIGPIVRDYRDGLGMSRRAKVLATTTILIVATASGPFAIHNRTVGMVVVAIGLVGAAFVIFAVPTRERVLADRADGLTWSRPATVRPRGYSSGTTSLRGEPRASVPSPSPWP